MLSIVVLFALFPLLSRFAVDAVTIVLVLLVVVAIAWHWSAVVPLALLCALSALFALLAMPSQLFFMLGIAAVVLTGRFIPWLHDTNEWLRQGSFNRSIWWLIIISVLLSAAALLLWYLYFNPDIADIIATFVPDWHPSLLIIGGLFFSMLNAAVEEGAYRGVVLDALDRTLGPGFAALLLQAIAFGTFHINGFPRGPTGVGLAFIFGLMMGLIRRRSGGMFAPWVAHVFTDIAIVGIVLFLAR